MLLEVADSSITYRSRYFTVLQAAPVLDLLMNDDANPRSLAFQLQDLFEHCPGLSGRPSGAGWPLSNRAAWRKPRPICGAPMSYALPAGREVQSPSPPGHCWQPPGAALPALSDAITHVYFSHAEMERAT